MTCLIPVGPIGDTPLPGILGLPMDFPVSGLRGGTRIENGLRSSISFNSAGEQVIEVFMSALKEFAAFKERKSFGSPSFGLSSLFSILTLEHSPYSADQCSFIGKL
jgi:hypothetical protein